MQEQQEEYILSADNGASWTAVNNGLTSQGVYALTFSGTNLFAGTGGGVFISTNFGNQLDCLVQWNNLY